MVRRTALLPLANVDIGGENMRRRCAIDSLAEGRKEKELCRSRVWPGLTVSHVGARAKAHMCGPLLQTTCVTQRSPGAVLRNQVKRPGNIPLCARSTDKDPRETRLTEAFKVCPLVCCVVVLHAETLCGMGRRQRGSGYLGGHEATRTECSCVRRTKAINDDVSGFQCSGVHVFRVWFCACDSKMVERGQERGQRERVGSEVRKIA